MRNWSLVPLTTLCVVSLACAAQTALTPQTIEAQLKGPIVLLRGMYDGHTLRFDATGNLIGQAKELPFSMSAVRLEKVKVKNSEVVIEAEREGLEFSYSKQRSVREQGWGEDVRIEIALDPAHPEELSSALAKVFSVGLDKQLANDVPAFWRPWLMDQLDPSVKVGATAPNTIDLGFDWDKPGSGNITPPKMDRSIIVMPEEPLIAQRAAFNGVSLVGFVVDTSGKPTEIRIVQPAGMGLDEAAVKMVSEFRFKPALEKDKPVAAYMIFAVPFSPALRGDFPHPISGFGGVQ